MDTMKLAQRATVGIVAGVAGIGAAVASHTATEAASRPDTGGLTKLGINLGLPIIAVGSIINVPGAARGGPMPAALLGAIGVGAATGIFTSAFSSIGE